MINIICIFVGYLLGSLSFGILVCKAMGMEDPRSQGSHNPGATNVLRMGDKKAAILTLAGDMLKGVVAVLLARLLGVDDWALAATAVAVFFGHLYPVFFGFDGGKGVATAAGAMLVLAPLAALAAVATWLIMAYGLRISSLAALTAAALTPIYGWLFGLPGSYLAALLIITVFLIWRHRENIRRLVAGKESKF